MGTPPKVAHAPTAILRRPSRGHGCREVLHGVGADGGRSEIPHLCSKLMSRGRHEGVCNWTYGQHPQYGWQFPEEIPEKNPETISERSLAGMPQTL